MEGIVTTKKEAALKALTRLAIVIKKLDNKVGTEDYDIYRDSAIKRLEFTVDTLQHFLKAYLQTTLMINIEDGASPRQVFKKCREATIISKDELDLFLDIVEDRNRTSHSYNETTADKIIKNIPSYYQYMKSLMDRL